MGKLFVIIGKSGSGKDSVFNLLKEDKQLNLEPLVLYTTRPMRSGEKDGREYHFIEDISETSKVIELRTYNTTDGIWKYATIDDGNIDLEHKNYITINTLEGLEKLQNYFGEDKVVPIYIYVDSDRLFERIFYREESMENPNYHELCRRYIADSKDFRDLPNSITIDNTFVNDNLELCVAEIFVYIFVYIRKVIKK